MSSLGGAAVHDAAVVVCNGIEKSVSDKLEYKSVVLGNKLQVMVVCDPKTDKAAAAMDVNVGHFSDPGEIPGLAHFLEHMLFLGTNKYPDENNYSAFLAENGGRSNAYTSMESTNYYFDCSHSALHGALDRFAQFFIAPLFTASATDRELLAVDQEMAKNLQDDMWRSYQLEKSTSNPRHPYSKFATGDSKTLRDEPAAKGIDVRAHLLKFHERYYSANRMKLVVIGREPLEILEGWTRELFSPISNTSAPEPQESYGTGGELPFRQGHEMGRLIEMVPVKDLRSIELTWALPSMLAAYQSSPQKYVSNLLGHEGPGSILSLLKKKGWANEIYAGLSSNNSDFSLFKVQVDCTEQGIGKVNEIVATVFGYIDLVCRNDFEGVQEWLWREVALQTANSFRFQSQTDPFGLVSKIASSMQRVPVEHALSSHLVRAFDRQGIVGILGQLRPERMQLFLSSRDVAIRREGMLSTERWYGTQHCVTRVEPAVQELWRSGALLSAEDAKELTLPHPNEFLPSDFTVHAFQPPVPVDIEELKNRVDNVSPLLVEALQSSAANVTSLRSFSNVTSQKAPGAKRSESQAQAPCLMERSACRVWSTPGAGDAELDDTDLWRPPVLIACGEPVGGLLWLKQDTTFKLPKSAVTVLLKSPIAYQDPYSAVLSEISTHLVQDRLNEFAYAAEIAGLFYTFRNTTCGVAIFVGGFSHKLSSLLETVANAICEPGHFTEQQFERSKDKYARELANFSKEQAYQHSIYNATVLLNVPRWHIDEKIREVDRITLDAVKAHVERLLRSAALETLVAGNATPEMALEFASIVSKRIGKMQPSTVLDASLVPRIVKLPHRSESYFLQHGCDPDNINSAVEVFFQMGPDDPKLFAPLQVFAQIAQEPCFNELRTAQQLGYIVFCGLRNDLGIVGLRFIVQSSRADPYTLDEKIEDFLATLDNIIAEMPEQTLQQHVDAVLESVLDKDKTLYASARRWTSEVEGHTYRFSRPAQLASAVANVTKSDLHDLFRERLSRSGPSRRKLVIGIFGAKHKDSLMRSAAHAAAGHAALATAHAWHERDAPSVYQVTSVKQFRTANALYPVQSRAQNKL